jgi:hypothetical protein
MKLYFKDNFFSSGKTVIWNERQDSLGEVDLRSAFGSSIDVYDAIGSLKFCRKGQILQQPPKSSCANPFS